MFVFDIETTGLPIGGQKTLEDFTRIKRILQVERFNGARLVQFAGILFDERFVEVERINVILKPSNFQVRGTEVHGITHLQAERKGIVFDKFAEIMATILPRVNVLIAHNVKFDRAVVASELLRHNMDRLANLLSSKPYYCSMYGTANLVGLPGSKLPKLSELYHFAHSCSYAADHVAHNAINDVVALASSLESLVKEGLLLDLPHCTLGEVSEVSSHGCPTAEQLAIVARSHHSNLIVDAVAGSGKTTTIIELYKSWRQKTRDIFVVTYNKRLQQETEGRLGEGGVVFTYHAFANLLFGQKMVKNDEALSDVLKDSHTIALPCRLLVIDEAQDMTPILYRLICRYLVSLEVHQRPTLVLLGDFQQCIYRFAEARPQFLTQADKLFGHLLSERDWERMTLSTSFRFGSRIARFLNTAVLSKPRLKGGHYVSGSVDYVTTSMSNPKFLRWVLSMVENAPESWMILAPFLLPQNHIQLNSGSRGYCPTPVAVLSDYLAGKVPCYVSIKSNSKEEELSKGKLLFLTYTRSKGLERDNVLVLGFDHGLAMSQGRPLAECDSSFYVACTRARRRLILVHDYRNEELPFLRLSAARRLFTRHNISEPKVKPSTVKDIALTEHQLTNRAPLEVGIRCRDKIGVVGENDTEKITIPTFAGGVGGGIEDISEINATAFGLIITRDPKSVEEIDSLLSCAVETWTELIKTRYLKAQLSKPYCWISRDDILNIRAVFERRLIDDFGVNLVDCCLPERGASKLIEVDEISVAVQLGEGVLLLPNGRYLLLATTPLTCVHILRLMVHAWVKQDAEQYFVYSFADDSLYQLSNSPYHVLESTVKDLIRAARKDHTIDDPNFVNLMLASLLV
jgi:DNA polymerase III epsilon subunit-like protein